MLTRKRILAAKIETTIGTAISLANADCGFIVYDPLIQPTASFIGRAQTGFFGPTKGVVGPRTGTLTFRTDLTGDGSGGVPAWASTFLPACGWVNSSGTFSPITAGPTASGGVKTITASVYQDGRIKSLRGCMGTFRIVGSPGDLVQIEWTFMGAFVDPADGAALSPTYPTTPPIRLAAGSISIGGWSPCYSSITIDAGNDVQALPCQTPADGSGIKHYIVADRTTTLTIDPESELVATANADTYNDWLDGNTDTFSLALVSGSDTITFAGPALQRTNIQETSRQGIEADTITAQFNRSSGDDNFTIAFSATP